MTTSPSIRHGLPIEIHVFVIDIADVEFEVMYRKCTSTVWVQEDANNLVLHRYVAWFIWFDGDLLRPLSNFGEPPGPQMTTHQRGLRVAVGS